MASCDDDFSLLSDDNHHHHHHHHLAAAHHQFTAAHRYLTGGAGGSSPSKVAGAADNHAVDYRGNNAAFCPHEIHPFSSDNGPNPFESDPDPDPDPSSARVNNSNNDKRKDRDELSDGGTSYDYKKSKSAVSGGLLGCGAGSAAVSAGSGEYRKDREEWSDGAIECLLDAYTEKYTQLNRGNLRGRDWEEVAAIVSERCENQSKSVEQCKNKVDNLKKRYKLERHRMSSGGSTVSHWPWFKKMEAIVGNSLPVKAVNEEEKVGGGSGGNMGRQQKRYALATPGQLGQISNLKSKSMATSKWQRVVFKISGAALAGTGPQNIDPKVIMLIAREVTLACRIGVQVAIVVGGRNFFCGDSWVSATGADRSTTYQIGMMATVMNSILLQSALEKMGVQTRVQTVFSLPEVGEPYNKQKAVRHLEKGRVVIFGGVGAGTGNPLFSTDTAAALRATEIHANVVLKGISVNGVYDCNSRNNNVSFEHVSFRELASRSGTSMDMMALSFCEENGIPVVIFNLLEPGNISRALCGEQVGTLIDQTGMIS